MNMNREILRIALPNIVSNITVPLMGIVSTAIAGHWGADSAATIVEVAGRYIVWIILIPVASAMPFIMDGIMVGATETKVMRNSMLLSTVAYFGIFYSLYPVIGNNALWLAFTLYMFLRGTLQLLMTRRLRLIYRKAAA